MSQQSAVAPEKMIFRKTHTHAGRHVAVNPQNSAMKHLCYARIVLNAATPAVKFSNGNQETGLICLSGQATVKAGGKEFALGKYDSIYIPRDSEIEVTADGSADLAEFSCEVEGKYPLKFVRYAELTAENGMKFTAGGPGNLRQVSMVLAKNVEAGRLLLGFTHSDPGNWTSWPPHEHAAMLEEIYVYFEMPEPAYGIQLVYNDTEYPELVTTVREGDAVLMPSGYHPNCSVPGHRIAFLWALAAHREVEDRQYGVVNVQPEFKPAAAAPAKSK
ncbi:MAG TPA: 5-deoxy-glucuronate isomerase [Candidatus Acidoferrum sp.]|nr:5-deoxy-glucuronate isomerase [Candidatus Acidoferrum sp.]